jgi:hypothetical protein
VKPLLSNSSSFESFSLEELTQHYDTRLRCVLDNVAPLKTRTIVVRPEAKWYNKEVREAKQVCRRAERAWRKSGLTVHRQIYIDKRKLVNNVIRSSKTEYYKGLIEDHKGDTKKLYKITNELLGNKSESPLPSGEHKVVANMFSDYFIDKITAIRDSIPSSQGQDVSPTSHTLLMQLDTFEAVSEQDIEKIIRSCARKSCPLDPWPTTLVKAALPELLPIITTIVNNSLLTGIVPDSFKEAPVTPLLKKSSLDCNISKNYRPVSNLSFISKILEKVVASQLNQHLTRNDLHEPFQSAYRKAHSTETALLKVQNDVIRAVGERKIVLLVMLDLSAAFDTVDHECLLATLEHLGVCAVALQWFRSYLSIRSQMVSIKGTLSESRNLSCGVPQGSVLGPILFTLYTSALGRLLQQEVPQYHMYADDTSLYLSVKPTELEDAVEQMVSCISLVQNWMCSHQLKMNDDKTEYLIISSKHMEHKIAPAPLVIGNSEINPSQSARYLGVTIDRFVTMESHISNVCRSSYMQLKNIAKLRPFIDRSSMECIIHGFVTTRLDYCNSLLCGLPSTMLHRLQLIQNTAARILTGTPKFEHITPVLRTLHWLPVEQRIRYKILLTVFKALHKLAPRYIQDMIVPYIPSRNLRSLDLNLLVVPRTSSSLIQARAFSVAGPLMWNSLPPEMRGLDSINKFKSKLKTYLFTQTFN